MSLCLLSSMPVAGGSTGMQVLKKFVALRRQVLPGVDDMLIQHMLSVTSEITERIAGVRALPLMPNLAALRQFRPYLDSLEPRLAQAPSACFKPIFCGFEKNALTAALAFAAFPFTEIHGQRQSYAAWLNQLWGSVVRPDPRQLHALHRDIPGLHLSEEHPWVVCIASLGGSTGHATVTHTLDWALNLPESPRVLLALVDPFLGSSTTAHEQERSLAVRLLLEVQRRIEGQSGRVWGVLLSGDSWQSATDTLARFLLHFLMLPSGQRIRQRLADLYAGGGLHDPAAWLASLSGVHLARPTGLRETEFARISSSFLQEALR